MLIRVTMVSPSQYALKFPATKPERMLSDAPPSREEVTTSRTCREFTEVNTFTNSGMIAPARGPQVMTAESSHQGVPSPSPPISRYEVTKVSTIETAEVSHTRLVSGVSKAILSAWENRAGELDPLSR